MSIDAVNETLINFSDLSSWTESNLGRRVSPSTCHRWRLRGCRGVRLETLLVGGIRVTSVEALQRFFERSTRAQDGQPLTENPSCHIDQVSHQKANEYLENEGMA